MAIHEVASNAAGKQPEAKNREAEEEEWLKGVRHLCEKGIARVPTSYVLPAADRPGGAKISSGAVDGLKLPVIDLARLRLPSERAAVLQGLDAACREFGFFQVVNHGIESEVMRGTMDVARRFFELPFEERARWMSSDIRSPVRYGTSFNQVNDGVLCWRDFLKLICQPLHAVLPYWPHSPPDLREVLSTYARANQRLFKELMEAALEALGIRGGAILDELDAGMQMMVANCFPACPQPELTLGMPPHSDYGLLTLLLQDDVRGLEVRHAGEWVLVDPLPNSFVVNIGDHFEIYSNGRYKSVLHRVRVNSARPRMSVASLHSLPPERVIGPAAELVDERNPRRYMDTDFAAFLGYLATSEGKHKSFLESRRLT